LGLSIGGGVQDLRKLVDLKDGHVEASGHRRIFFKDLHHATAQANRCKTFQGRYIDTSQLFAVDWGIKLT
jgi:hypothetical protein